MQQTMTPEQQAALRRDLALVPALLALPGVIRHDTRFEGEIALVSPTTSLSAVCSAVERVMAAPVKASSGRLPPELASGNVLDAMGGIRDDQTLYLKSLGGDLSLYVAFWPWGGDAQFTIKIGVLVR